jgi:hypothetical protein
MSYYQQQSKEKNRAISTKTIYTKKKGVPKEPYDSTVSPN